MQKIITYSYTNRIQLLADLAGFNVEYTNVYQRNVKIYKGIDNTLEFDIKNADQKRIDLTTFSSIYLNIMDISGKGLPNSPYTVTPTLLKGIATVTIPASDLDTLTLQSLQYSVTAISSGIPPAGGDPVVLYTDSLFSAIGMIELSGNVVPPLSTDRLFKSFTGEIDFIGNVLNHSSAIPATYYEAIPTTHLSFAISFTDFIGTIYLEATTDQTISVESFKNSPKIQTWTTTASTTSIITFSNIPIDDYCYFRIVWHTPLNPGYVNNFGKVNQVIVTSDS